MYPDLYHSWSDYSHKRSCSSNKSLTGKKIVYLLLSLIFCENKKDLKVSSFNEPIDFLFKKNINELANISDVFLKKSDLNNMHDAFYMIPSVYILKTKLKLISW